MFIVVLPTPEFIDTETAIAIHMEAFIRLNGYRLNLPNKEKNDLYYLLKNLKKGLTFAPFYYFAPSPTNPSFTPVNGNILSLLLVEAILERAHVCSYPLEKRSREATWKD